MLLGYIRSIIISGIMLVILVLVSACTSSQMLDTEKIHTQGSEEEHHHGEEEQDHNLRVPNAGAVIRILSPGEGDRISTQNVIVEVEVDNFDLTESENHWHVYVDGKSWGMIKGGDTSYVLQGVDPGGHEISVYLATGTHEELENGSSVTGEMYE